MSTFQLVALGIAAVCIASIAAVFILLHRAAHPRLDPVDELFRDFGLNSPRRARRTRRKRNATIAADEFEDWLNKAIEESFARSAKIRAEFEERLRSSGLEQPMIRPSRSWRTVLGVGQGATLREAQAAFRKIAKETHPESAGEKANPARFQEAVEAYDAAQRELKT